MAVTSTDLLMIERGGTLYKAPVSELPSGGGGAAGLVLLQKEVITTAVSAVDLDIPTGYSRFLLTTVDVEYSSAASTRVLASSDGGSTLLGYPNYQYRGSKQASNGGLDSYASGSGTSAAQISAFLVEKIDLTAQITVQDTSLSFSSIGSGVNSDDNLVGFWNTASVATLSRSDLFRLFPYSGTISSGTFSLYGYKEDV